MKSLLKNVKISKRMPALLGVLSGVCLLTTGMTYLQINQTLGGSERASQLTSTLLAAEQNNMLLRQLASGKEDSAKNFLASALAYNLKEVATLAPGVEDSRMAFAMRAVKVIERQKKESGATYLVSNQRNSVASISTR